MRNRMRAAIAALALMLGYQAQAATTPITLPNGRTLAPAGTTYTLGNLPFDGALSADGRWLAVLHGGKSTHGVDLFDTEAGKVVQTVRLPDSFHGLAWGPDRTLLVSGAGTHSLLRLKLADGALGVIEPMAAEGYPAGLAVASDSVYVADNVGDRLLRLPFDAAQATSSVKVGPTPFATFLDRAGNVLVASWGEPVVTVLRPNGAVTRLAVGSHPTAIAQHPRTGQVYVANANDDTLSVLDRPLTKVQRTIKLAAYPGAPLGSTPTALAFSPDGKRLYVALSGVNALVVLDPATGAELGRIPTAWYPSSVSVAPDGKTLYITCAKGLGAGPRKGGRPTWDMDGLLQVVPAPDGSSLKALTRTVAKVNGFAETPAKPTWMPPIRHIVYVVRENRTYDQVFGDLPKGDGDPSLTVFGSEVTPNAHALAERFAFGDRFFCDGEVSAQGHQWTQGGISSNAVERLWPPVYAHKGRWVDSDDPLIYPDSDYLIDRCVERGVSCRMYGDYLRKGKDGKILPHLRGLRSTTFKGWDLKYSDLDRLKAWEAEFKAGTFPAFSYVWLPNDHTAGTRPGMLTPRAMVAQNDLATGRMIDLLSHDPRWKDTLVIIQEDDAQAGYDHVDGHRSVLLLASPWIKAGTVTSTHYSQVSLVATVAHFLKLGALTQYDAQTNLITDVWSRTPDMRPFEALPAKVSLEETNTPSSPLASQSLRFDFSTPDAGDQSFLARALWLAARQPIRR
ncbi:MAG TPA: alkaline phosphatase family protein [Stenomitos sp.]